MRTRIAVATLAVLAVASAPLASAKPNGNRPTQPAGQSVSAPVTSNNKPATPPGQAISSIARNGGGPAGILAGLLQRKPTNKGLQNALDRVTKRPTPTPTPDPTPTPTPDPTPTPTPDPTPTPTPDPTP